MGRGGPAAVLQRRRAHRHRAVRRPAPRDCSRTPRRTSAESRRRGSARASIDLDILLFGDEEWASERLTIPHPRMARARLRRHAAARGRAGRDVSRRTPVGERRRRDAGARARAGGRRAGVRGADAALASDPRQGPPPGAETRPRARGLPLGVAHAPTGASPAGARRSATIGGEEWVPLGVAAARSVAEPCPSSSSSTRC